MEKYRSLRYGIVVRQSDTVTWLPSKRDKSSRSLTASSAKICQLRVAKSSMRLDVGYDCTARQTWARSEPLNCVISGCAASVRYTSSTNVARSRPLMRSR